MYADYTPDDQKEDLRKMFSGEKRNLERRKVGLGSWARERAKNLQVQIPGGEKTQIPLQPQTRVIPLPSQTKGIVPFSYQKSFHL